MLEETNKKKKNRKILLIIVGAISGLCILCLIIGTIYNATPQGKEEATKKALTEIAMPTDTLTPSKTAIFTRTLNPTSTPEPIEESYITYVVINDTTLWRYLVSEDPCYTSDVPCEEGLRPLALGTLLKPTDNAKDLFCVDDTVDEITMTLCSVEVVETGETGWVKQQWIEPEE